MVIWRELHPLCCIQGLLGHKAQILRVPEDGNFTGQKLVDKHWQPSLAVDHVLRVIVLHGMQGTEPVLGHLVDFEAHLCDDECANLCAVACHR